MKRPAWLIPGLVAAILFAGGVASNLVANDLERFIGPYGRWVVWVVFAIALVVAVVMAIVDTRRRGQSTTAEKIRSVKASGERSVAIGGKVERSTIVTGSKNVVDSKADGDIVARDKIIINQAANSTVNALHQLRAPVGDFVGREHEIETLIKSLRSDSRACISGINGMGGIGKTELALLVAERLTDDYPDAQFFINLQGTEANPRSSEEVLATCIRAFIGPEAALPEDRDQLLQRYCSELSGKRVLLLLDNVADSGQVQPLLPPPGSAVLVTSRQAVTLPGMTRLKLNLLTDDEAQELLVEIAPHAKAAAEQICELCGYLPLAIRAAGSLLAVTDDLDPFAYASQLKDERNRLEHIGTEGVEIGVAASLNLSYERLASETARVFRLLSVFPGTFDAAAEEVVCADIGHAQLSDLVRRSLVLYDSDTKRYRLHDLARLFADLKLIDEERADGHKRHATHYKAVLAGANKLYLQGGEALARGLALFDLEWGNIQSGHTWVAAQGVETDEDMAQLGMTYPDVGTYLLDLRLQGREWIEWLEFALAAARQLKNRQGEGNALSSLGNGYMNLRQTQRAVEFFEQALLIDRELGDRIGEGIDLGNLGNAYGKIGDTKGAIQFYEKCLTIVRELGDRRSEGTALGNLGVVYNELGDNQQAIQFYEQQLLIVREIGDRRGEGNALSNMCLVLEQLGKRAEAIQHAEQSLTIYEQIEDPRAAKVRAQLAEWREESGHK